MVKTTVFNCFFVTIFSLFILAIDKEEDVHIDQPANSSRTILYVAWKLRFYETFSAVAGRWAHFISPRLYYDDDMIETCWGDIVRVLSQGIWGRRMDGVTHLLWWWVAVRKKSQRTYTPCVLNDFISSFFLYICPFPFYPKYFATKLSIGQHGRERHIDYICVSFNNRIIAEETEEEELEHFTVNSN